MELSLSIPARFAQRLSIRYQLQPPVDVRGMLAHYAEVVDTPIPIEGVDGICLDLKTPGRRPRVIINSSNPPLRRRFTEAHELGHILIPWHRGTIIDDLDAYQGGASGDYWTFEVEANEFAAELLMPTPYVAELIRTCPDPGKAHARLCETCQVSALAAFFRLGPCLPPNVVYVAERNGEVEFSGRSKGTLANAPTRMSAFDPNVFGYADAHHCSKAGARRLHWWVLPNAVNAEASDPRGWRELLEEMVDELGVPLPQRPRFKMSVNGVLSAANGTVRRKGIHTRDAVVAACLQRFHDREDLRGIANHPLFMDFVIKRASELTQ